MAISTVAVYAAGGGVLHQISIAALVLALGLLVDNAIVVAESVQRHLDEGLTPSEAARQAVRDLAAPGHRHGHHGGGLRADAAVDGRDRGLHPVDSDRRHHGAAALVRLRAGGDAGAQIETVRVQLGSKTCSGAHPDHAHLHRKSADILKRIELISGFQR